LDAEDLVAATQFPGGRHEMLGKITPPGGIFEPAGSLRQVVMSFCGDL
jgi:hypothetical protein